jgi:hypothetical protein
MTSFFRSYFISWPPRKERETSDNDDLELPCGKWVDSTLAPIPAATNWCKCYDRRYDSVANTPIMPKPDGQLDDLAAIVAVYRLAVRADLYCERRVTRSLP